MESSSEETQGAESSSEETQETVEETRGNIDSSSQETVEPISETGENNIESSVALASQPSEEIVVKCEVVEISDEEGFEVAPKR